MNVQNRKLFRNKDARRQLAAMGGIMRSSPELAGEAARFAEGGTARERAISGQGALDEFASSRRTPVDLRAIDQALGSMVQDVDRQVQTAIVSFLGNVFQVVGDRIFHSDTGIEIEEPSLKREILTQGDRIAAEDMAMAQDVPQGQPRVFAQPEAEPEIMFPGELSRAFVPEQDVPLSLQQRIAEEDMAMAQDVPQGQSRVFAQPEVMLPEAKPEVMFPGELSRPFVPQEDAEPEGRANPYVQAMIDAGLSEDPVTFDPQGLFSPSMGRSMSSAPYDVSRLAAPKIDDSQISTDALIEQAKGLLSPEAVSRIESGDVAGTIENAQTLLPPQNQIDTVPGTTVMVNGETFRITAAGNVVKLVDGKLLPATTLESMQAMSVAQNEGADYTKSPVGEFGSYEVDPNTGIVPEGAQFTPMVESLPSMQIGDLQYPDLEQTPLVESLKENVQKAVDFFEGTPPSYQDRFSGRDDLGAVEGVADPVADSAPSADQVKTEQLAQEDLVVSAEENTNRAGFTPDAAKDTANVALAAAEASKDPGANLPSTITTNLGAGSSSSIEEATKAQYKFLKDFLGIGERDKQKEFNLMAMQFFTALAAGQSPDALANLNAAASTAIAGLAASDKERTALDRDLKLAAYEQALAEEGRKEDRADKNFRAYLSAGFVPIIDPLTKQISGFEFASKQKVSPYEPFVDAVVNLAKAAVTAGDVPKGMTAIDYATRELTPLYKSQGLPVGNYELKKDPKVEDLIAKERNKGKTDAQIKAMIVAAGIDPAVYGM